MVLLYSHWLLAWTHHVHGCSHRQVKGVERSLILHYGFIPAEALEMSYFHLFINRIPSTLSLLRPLHSHLSMVKRSKSTLCGGAVIRSSAWPSSVWNDVWRKNASAVKDVFTAVIIYHSYYSLLSLLQINTRACLSTDDLLLKRFAIKVYNNIKPI